MNLPDRSRTDDPWAARDSLLLRTGNPYKAVQRSAQV